MAKKLQALWIAGYNLSVVRDRSDQAMIAWIKRQTGLDHHRFLHDPKDANKAIDALKLWIRRSTLSDHLFTQDKTVSPLLNDYRFQVCVYIWSELVKAERTPNSTLTGYLLDRTGRTDVHELTSSEWIAAMNVLGKIYRAVRRV